jgi:hypothetical protein
VPVSFDRHPPINRNSELRSSAVTPLVTLKDAAVDVMALRRGLTFGVGIGSSKWADQGH